MAEPNFLTKLVNWIAATGLSNLDGGDNPHPTPKLPGANTYQIYENLNKRDTEAVRDALSAQHEYEKGLAPVKGATAAAAATLPLWGPYALHVGKVLLNPATAKTALGGAVATTADLVGTGYGIKRNSELLDKWTSGNFNWSDPVEFTLNSIPGYGLSKGVKAGANMLEKVNAFQKLKRASQNMSSEVTKEPIMRVFTNTGLGLGKNNPHALRTTSESVYRVTGQDQIDDIMTSGYIRPKPGAKVKGGHTNEVHFAQGDPNLFYYDKRPVIEISTQDVVDGQVGAIPKDKIKAIWKWSDNESKYVNMLEPTADYPKQLTLFPNSAQDKFTEASMLAARKRALGDSSWESDAARALKIHSKEKLPGVYKTIDDVTYGFDFPYGPQETITLTSTTRQPYDILIVGSQVPKEMRSRVGARQYKQYLKDLGYDLSGVSDELLGGIMHARQHALKDMTDVVIAYPDNMVLRHNNAIAGKLELGDLRTEWIFTAPTVQWYGRTTPSGDRYFHDNLQNWYKGNVTSALYNAAILEARRQGYPGIFSGIALLEPGKTARGLSKFARIEFPWKGTRAFSGIDDYADAIYKKHLYETGDRAAALSESKLMKELLEQTPEGSSTELWTPGTLQLLVGGKSNIPAKSIFLDPKYYNEILNTGKFVGNKGFHYKTGGQFNKYKNQYKNETRK